MERNWRLDNARAVLIVLVVLGHMTRWTHFPGADFLYRMIYSFHMPAFALLSGLCWKGIDKGRVLTRLGWPYVIFQTLYLLFDRLGPLTYNWKPEPWTYTKPYWLLWYLMALMAWNVLAAVMPEGKRAGIAVLAGSVVVALLAGVDPGLDYYLSLSRTLVLFPFFWGGVWLQRYGRPIPAARWHKLAAAGIFLLCAGGIFLLGDRVNVKWMYHSFPYLEAGYTPLIRLGLLALAAVLIPCLLTLMPDRRVDVMTYLGQNTMSVFLLHGFVVRGFGWLGAFRDVAWPWFLLPILATLLALLLASPPVVRVVRPLMRWPFEKKKQIITQNQV
jgi:fucose 4-O-acetylase-like acetyltransferase